MKLFGRDKNIENLWKSLEDKSVLLTAERRMGKTEVLKKLRKYPKDDHIVIYSDLEGVSTPIEFVNYLINSLKPYQNKKKKTIEFFNGLMKKFGGTEIAGVVKIPESQAKQWKELLTQVIVDVCQTNADKKILFLWDEVPYMLQKIEEKGADKMYSGLEILDVLRTLRQEHANLRMIFTGSIGLHHVVTELKSHSFSSEPTNDMEKIKLPPLLLEDAVEMAKYRLVEKEVICLNPSEDILRKISKVCDCVIRN